MKKRARHTIVNTNYGEVMVKESIYENVVECYIGDNFDDCIGEIEDTTIDDPVTELKRKVEDLLGC